MDTCLIHALRALGVGVQSHGPGPFWALLDGNAFLEPFAKELVPVDTANCGRGRSLSVHTSVRMQSTNREFVRARMPYSPIKMRASPQAFTRC